MQLTAAQVEAFDRDGYVFIPDVFSKTEIDTLTGELPGAFAQKRDEVVREKGSDAPRSPSGS